VSDANRVFANGQGPRWVRLRVAAIEGKKTDKGTTMCLTEPKRHGKALADWYQG
jgi:hypothetical protein